MALSIDDITAKFPVKVLPRIEGEPNYDSIQEMVQMLYGNASSIPTTLGGGAHGHLGLVMSPALYFTIAAAAYTAPINPGALPHYPNGRIGVELRQQIRDMHVIETRLFDTHNNVADALKTQIIQAVDELYLQELHHKYTMFLGVSVRDIIMHLLDRYVRITPADLQDNKQRFNEAYDSALPITAFFQKMEDAMQFATDGKIPFTDEQVLQTPCTHQASTMMSVNCGDNVGLP